VTYYLKDRKKLFERRPFVRRLKATNLQTKCYRSKRRETFFYLLDSISLLLTNFEKNTSYLQSLVRFIR
jgi:hypothetical protein